MKKIVIALAVLALTGCAKEWDDAPEGLPQVQTVTISAGIDPATKTAYDAEGKFSWVAGDKIGVLVSNGVETKQVTFVADASGATTTFTGQLESGYEIQDLASYPFTGAYDGYACNDLAWDAAKGGWRIWGSIKPSLENPLSCTPLIGKRVAGTRSFNFTAATGIVKFTVKNVPMETAFAYLEVPDDAANCNLNGWYDITRTGCLSMAQAVEPWKDRYNWNVPAAENSTLDYYFFLPVGTLPKGTRFELRNADWETIHAAEFRKAVEVQRNVVTRMAPIELEGPEPLETPGTGLRTIHIDTPDGQGITSKEVWTTNCRMVIVDDNGKTYYSSEEVQVKGRGNSTWGYPKKPYAIKLPEKFDLIGTGADKSWVLLANWMDRTLLRNEVAFELGRRSGLDWTPSGEFVELYLNGKHQGNYWLGEKIKTGKARLTADFLIEMDTYFDEDWRFYSQYGRRVNEHADGLPVMVKEPDDMTEELFQALQALVAGVEGSLYLGEGDYREKLDAASFADWYLIHELTWNGEPNHPKSSYFHFRDGIMYAGPLWDFDWYTFQPSTSGLLIPESIYFKKLLADENFKEVLRARWAVLKPSFETMGDYIDAKAAEIHASEALNWAKWPCSTSWVNGDERMGFDSAVSRMKNALLHRITTLDQAVGKL